METGNIENKQRIRNRKQNRYEEKEERKVMESKYKEYK